MRYSQLCENVDFLLVFQWFSINPTLFYPSPQETWGTPAESMFGRIVVFPLVFKGFGKKCDRFRLPSFQNASFTGSRGGHLAETLVLQMFFKGLRWIPWAPRPAWLGPVTLLFSRIVVFPLVFKGFQRNVTDSGTPVRAPEPKT